MNPGTTVRSAGPQESVTVASAPPQLSKAADGGTANEFNGDEEIRSCLPPFRKKIPRGSYLLISRGYFAYLAWTPASGVCQHARRWLWPCFCCQLR